MKKRAVNRSGPKIFCLSSGKGGVGKTSITVNLGLAAASMGKKVLLVDGDLGLANIDVMLNLDVAATVNEVISGDCPASKAVVHPRENLSVLPAASGISDVFGGGAEEQQALREMLSSLSRGYDLVLIDAAAGIGPSVMWFNSFSRYNVVVMTPDPTSLTDAYALVKVLYQGYHRKEFFILVNLASSAREARKAYDDINRVAARFLGLDLVMAGWIPTDPAMARGIRNQEPVMEGSGDSPASRAIHLLAEGIVTGAAFGLEDDHE